MRHPKGSAPRRRYGQRSLSAARGRVGPSACTPSSRQRSMPVLITRSVPEPRWDPRTQSGSRSRSEGSPSASALGSRRRLTLSAGMRLLMLRPSPSTHSVEARWSGLPRHAVSAQWRPADASRGLGARHPAGAAARSPIHPSLGRQHRLLGESVAAQWRVHGARTIGGWSSGTAGMHFQSQAIIASRHSEFQYTP